jgi:transposase
MEGGRNGARKVHLAGLRENQPSAGAVLCDCAGLGGPSLLAMILYEKFGQHQPLNRQAERHALEGVPISLSTMADAVGAKRSLR